MAKKKADAASPFVPPEEQPYQVPENWRWIRMLSAFDNRTDSNKKLPKKEYAENGEIPVVDQGKELIGGYTDKVELSYEGSIPVVVFGDHTRCFKFIDFDFVQGADGIKVLVPKPFWHRKAFYYAIQSIDIPNMGYRRHYPLFEQFSVPLPPLAEQQRIVERIESLFAKLDEAKEKAQEALESFEVRKAAMLHKAFNGELTTEWRKKYKRTISSWEMQNLQNVCVMNITDGTHKTPEYCDKENGVPFISAKDVTSGKINWNNIKYIVPKLHEVLYARIAPQKDDILLAKNGTTGVAAIVETDEVFDIYVTLAVLRPNKEKIIPKYLLYIINSPYCKNQFDLHLTGIGVPNLHLRDIKEIKIQLPPLDEQDEIVRILDDFFAKEAQAKAKITATLAALDAIKKAILAKAFRGELGTNNPADGSAEELLRRTLA